MKQNQKKEATTTEQSVRYAYNITGVSGEYFAAAELSRRGWIAVLTLKNTPNIDLIATTPDGRRTVNIQVKTRSIGNRQGWLLNKGIETIVPGKNFYIVFVDLQGVDSRPDYYIVPKNFFAKWMAKHHRSWLDTPGLKGHVRVDSSIRGFNKAQLHIFERYHNNWDI